MYTRCPECNTVFRIARAQLDAADGEVRCGRCNGIFNAREALIDDSPEGGAPGPSDGDPEAITDTPDELAPAGGDEALLEFSLPEDRWGEVFLDHELDEAEPGREAGTGDTGNATDPGEHAYRDVAPPVRADAAVVDDAAGDPAGERWPPGDGDPSVELGKPPGATADGAGPGVLGTLVLRAEAARRSGRRYWTLAFVVLLAALTVQIVHLNRTTLVALPWLGDVIERAYERAGAGLHPRARVADYRIVTAAASMETRNDGLLRVRATVANAAGHAQRYPLIRLTLKDRWGESVGERLVEPQEYAVGDVAAGALLAPGAKTDAEIRIVDPGADAFGFELDICLRDAQGRLSCAASNATR
jgi:predicted Zn finger-like uncharacterized protein